MRTEILVFILLGLLVLGAALFLFQSFLKAAILTMVILTLFRIGWVYTSEDITNKFKLDTILNRENYIDFRAGYDDYVERREHEAIVNPEALEDTVKGEILNKINEYWKKNEK